GRLVGAADRRDLLRRLGDVPVDGRRGLGRGRCRERRHPRPARGGRRGDIHRLTSPKTPGRSASSTAAITPDRRGPAPPPTGAVICPLLSAQGSRWLESAPARPTPGSPPASPPPCWWQPH